MSRVPSVPRCSARNIACRRTSCATASAIPSRPDRSVAVPAAAFVFGLLIAGGGAAGAQPRPEAQPPPETQPPPDAPPSLAEAARKNRARSAASRARHGPAPRFTDTDLAGARAPGPRQPPAPLESNPLRDPPVTSEDLPAGDSGENLPAGDSGEDTADPGADDVRAAIEARLRAIGEREAAIRERLLDIEASLTAIGASGLPYAQRNPNRVRSPLDTSRLRAEREELNRELDALAAERRILR